MTTYNEFAKNNIAPYAASRIGVYDNNGNRVGYIPLDNFKPDYGERLYRFGLISDVHNEENQNDANADDLKNALKFFNDKESVEFTVISGDLTQYSHNTGNISTEMKLFKQYSTENSPSTPIYPTTGNHDCPSSSDIDISTFFSYTDAKNIAPSNDAEYSYEYTATHTTSDGIEVTDHFLFLGMKRYNFTSDTYSDTDITWLSNKLESYKNDRCFVITHMFFPDAAGNLKQIYPQYNWLSGTQLTSLINLRNSYPKVIWFSGHSHWKWYLQKYEEKANVWPVSNAGRTSAWCVHVPSCAYPIDSNGNDNKDATNGGRETKYGQSEGAIVDVYKDYIDIRAIAFKDEGDSSYGNRYLPIAQYRLYNEPTSAEPKTILHTTIANTSCGLGIKLEPATSGGCYVSYSDIKVLNNGTNITDNIISTDDTKNNDYKIGVYAIPSSTTNITSATTAFYVLKPSNDKIYAIINTNHYSEGYTVCPLIQSSSSSPASSSNSFEIYMDSPKYSLDGITWITLNSKSTNLLNGDWSNKASVELEWLDSMDG